jgi:hypothetical protein
MNMKGSIEVRKRRISLVTTIHGFCIHIDLCNFHVRFGGHQKPILPMPHAGSVLFSFFLNNFY